MKKRARFFSCLLLAFVSLSIGLPRTAFTQEGQPGASLKKPLATTTDRNRGDAIDKPAPQDEKQVAGERKSIVRTATINFAELARRDALTPMSSSQERRYVPTPKKEGEPGERPVPTNAQVFRQSDAAAFSAQALGPSPVASPTFQGVQATGWIPPDTQGAVGLNHLLVAVNGGVLVQTKTGSNVGFVRSLVNFFSAVANGSSDVFDPRVQYDPYSNRWILIAVADRDSAASAVLVGVSQTNDPTAFWNLYRIDADSSNQSWADYPMFGFNKDWIVISTNMFRNTGSSAPFYSRFYVLNKANFYAGQTGFYTQLDAPSGVSGTIAPASTYDPNLSTMYLLQNWNGSFNGNGFLRLYTITGAVGSETLNNTSQGIFISTANTWASFPPGDFAPQLGTSNKIQVNDADMQNVVYRNGSLWCTHTIFLPSGGPTRSSVQWWQINPTSVSVQQLGRIDSANGTYFYGFPSISVNRDNDVLIGYSRFSSTHYASAGYAYRAGTDAPNSLRDDTVLKAGVSTYFSSFGGRNRWGDYSGTAVDPANDTDMWTLQEYASATNTWSTWWGRIGNAPPPPPLANDNFTGAQVISGNSGSVSGNNVGATKESGEPNHGGNVGGASVWYRWQAPASGNMTINTTGSNYDTLLAAYTGSSVSTLTLLNGNDDNPAGGLQSIVTFSAVAGTVYHIAVDGYNGDTGNITLNWNLSVTINPLRIDNVLPKAGRASGGQQVKLTGDFAALSSVTIGGAAASWSYTNGTSEITLVTPSHAVGAVNIVLTPTTGSTLTRNNAFAYLPTVFTDDTLVVGVTIAKAQHIIELRQAVDALRAVAGLGAAAWTDPTLTPSGTLLKAVHITELRSNLEAAAAQLGYAAASYTDPSLTGLPVKRVHIEELRQRIRAIAG